VKKPKVLLITLPGMWDLKESDISPLKKIADVDFVQTKHMTEEQLGRKCEGYDYLMLNMDFLPAYPDKMERLTEKFYNIPAVKNLKGINVDMTDADFFSPQMAKKLSIPLQTTPNAVTISVAESAITEIMVHARNRHLAYQDEIKKKDVECRKSLDLHGKIACIIGYGNIGKNVANILRAVGMTVLVNDIATKDTKITPIEEIFRKADVISIHIPALEKGTNKSNINFINSKLLNLCKGTILINLATDIIVNTDDLIQAIKSKKIIGYSYEPGRDVSKKLKQYDVVHVSPCSFDSNESRKNVVDIWFKNMITMIEGKPQNLWN
jgi:phosphoglycerate dehydrogenase-like enzyme